jgi:hypothetical protein
MKVGEVHFERPGLVRATVNPSFTEAPRCQTPRAAASTAVTAAACRPDETKLVPGVKSLRLQPIESTG